MICKDVIEHMNEDELRTYVVHQERVLEIEQELRYAFQGLSRAWKQLVIDIEHCDNCFDAQRDQTRWMREYENMIEEKYSQYMPRPVCDARLRGDNEKA